MPTATKTATTFDHLTYSEVYSLAAPFCEPEDHEHCYTQEDDTGPGGSFERRAWQKKKHEDRRELLSIVREGYAGREDEAIALVNKWRLHEAEEKEQAKAERKVRQDWWNTLTRLERINWMRENKPIELHNLLTNFPRGSVTPDMVTPQEWEAVKHYHQPQ